MVSTPQALVATCVMGLVILFCRACPFLFFRKAAEDGIEKGLWKSLVTMAEKVAPPVAMTVLSFNAICAPIKENPSLALPVLAASLFTAVMHLWKRNMLLSIVGGTAVYMVLERLL